MTACWRWLRGVGRKHLAGILAGLVVVGLVHVGWLESLENWAFDRLFALRGQHGSALPIVIVGIDESTIAELGEQWPFARAMHGAVIRKIAEGGPRAIALDFIFDTPSLRGPADDEAFGAAIAAAGNVILGAF